MSYGIYDCDLRNGAPLFNLELMKLSAYYKNKGEIVAYSTRFRPERFNHFIIGKDRIDSYFNYPIHQYNNVEVIGRFFSPKKYCPLDLAIEKQVPDTYLYNKMLNRYIWTRENKMLYQSQLNGEHLRLSLDGKTLWNDLEKQFYGRNMRGSIFIYDYDVSKINNVAEALYDLTLSTSKKRHKTILFKFPIKVKSATDLAPWLKLKYFQNRTSFIIESPLKQKDIDFIIENQNKLKNLQILYDVSKNTTYEEFLDNTITLYKQIYFLRTILNNFSLIYDKGFFKAIEWEHFITILSNFSLSRGRLSKGKQRLFELLYEYLKFFYMKNDYLNGLSINDTKKCFLFIAEENYELFKLFYEYDGGENE